MELREVVAKELDVREALFDLFAEMIIEADGSLSEPRQCHYADRILALCQADTARRDRLRARLSEARWLVSEVQIAGKEWNDRRDAWLKEAADGEKA